MRPVNLTPVVSKIISGGSLAGIEQGIQSIIQTVTTELADHARRINGLLARDGTEAMTGPIVLASYVKTQLPTAAAYTAGLIYVSNEAGGAVPAFSDGTNWRRVTDRAVVS